jgi:hypothetical protein
MSKLTNALFFLLMFCASTYAQEWKTYVNEFGQHNAQASATGKSPDGPITTIFNLRCKPKEHIVLSYVVRGVSDIKYFKFQDFEGPTAKAALKKLVTIKVQTKSETILVRTSVSGSRGFYPETNAFQFEIASGNPKVKNNISRILNAILHDPLKISITVQSDSDRKKTLNTEFSSTNASNSVTHMLKGCGKP